MSWFARLRAWLSYRTRYDRELDEHPFHQPAFCAKCSAELVQTRNGWVCVDCEHVYLGPASNTEVGIARTNVVLAELRLAATRKQLEEKK